MPATVQALNPRVMLPWVLSSGDKAAIEPETGIPDVKLPAHLVASVPLADEPVHANVVVPTLSNVVPAETENAPPG
jgi:hypothetical protein